MTIHSPESLREAFDHQLAIQAESQRRAIYRMIFALAIVLGTFWACGEYSIARQINEDWYRSRFEHQFEYRTAAETHMGYLVNYALFAAGLLVAVSGLLGLARVSPSRWLLLVGVVAVVALKAIDLISTSHLHMPTVHDRRLSVYLMVTLRPVRQFLLEILFCIIASIALILTPWPRKTTVA